ncbi:acetyltransferase, fucose-4-O-acetylase [Mycobacteroides abscessus subsp. bolletii]|uniref:acyltransferase family protein n=1 Tax=Mycobacteroides abscessus TaxID=36809 RepID=UPI00092C050C|nr:acyltransferase [Mycobacteroides abscessus]SII87923.1 acetyltransferase, fucose-4-O-acetylase [Mycobacteroides abscessus subsp. bolletii]
MGDHEHPSRERDRVLDAVRLMSLATVVAYHVLAGSPTLVRGKPAMASNYNVHWLFWLVPLMPLFFFAGAAANVPSWESGKSWGQFLMGRATRLFRPVFYFLAVVALITTLLHITMGNSPQLLYLEMRHIELLWYVGAYLLTLAFMPWLARIRTAHQLGWFIAAMCLLTTLTDTVSLITDTWLTTGWINMIFMWLIPAALGIGYQRRLVPRPVALTLASVALAATVALAVLGPYPSGLIANMPPTLLLAASSIVECLAVIAFAPTINRWVQGARTWRFFELCNSGSMTIYLWHWVVTFLLSYGVYLTFRIGLLSQHDAWYWPANVLRLLIVCAVVAVFFVPLRATERRPLPWWDRPVPAMNTGRDIAVGVLVLVGAILTLVYTRIYVIDPHWGGFTPIGRWIVVASLVPLAAARFLCRKPLSPTADQAMDGRPLAHSASR